jgi:exosome complex component RRP4
MLHVKDKDVAVPGEVLAEGLDFLPSFGTFRDGNFIVSKVLGLVKISKNAVKVVPLAGRYTPQEGDYVIGTIIDAQLSSWIVDINSPYEAILPLSAATEEFIDTRRDDISKFFHVGDVIFTKIERVTRNKNIQVSMRDRRARKLRGGRIVEIFATKVPRLIGKQGSMIEMIKHYTGCNIVVGQNGWVWVKGEQEDMALEAIDIVDRESHTSGLTDRIKALLEKEAEARGLKVTPYVVRPELQAEMSKEDTQ